MVVVVPLVKLLLLGVNVAVMVVEPACNRLRVAPLAVWKLLKARLAVLMAVVIAGFTGGFHYLPHAVLAATIIVAVTALIDIDTLVVAIEIVLVHQSRFFIVFNHQGAKLCATGLPRSDFKIMRNLIVLN